MKMISHMARLILKKILGLEDAPLRGLEGEVKEADASNIRFHDFDSSLRWITWQPSVNIATSDEPHCRKCTHCMPDTLLCDVGSFRVFHQAVKRQCCVFSHDQLTI